MMEYKNLTGVSEKYIKSFEDLFKISLPDDFKEYYTLKDGSGNLNLLHILICKDSYATFSLIPMQDMTKIKVYFCDHDERMEKTYDNFEKIDKKIKPYLSNKKWFPFAQTKGMAMYLMLDYDPTDKGTMGQIICYVCEPRYVYYVAPTLSTLFEESIECLKIVRGQEKR
jgi:cell wall assembly regulator SMI1